MGRFRLRLKNKDREIEIEVSTLWGITEPTTQLKQAVDDFIFFRDFDD